MNRHRSRFRAAKRSWEPMRLQYVGHVGEVLATGGVGKSPTPSDADGLRGKGAG
jgi:hypothetical protein